MCRDGGAPTDFIGETVESVVGDATGVLMKRYEAKVLGQLQRWIQPQFIGRRRAGGGLELGDQTLALGFKGREDAK